MHQASNRSREAARQRPQSGDDAALTLTNSFCLDVRNITLYNYITPQPCSLARRVCTCAQDHRFSVPLPQLPRTKPGASRILSSTAGARVHCQGAGAKRRVGRLEGGRRALDWDTDARPYSVVCAIARADVLHHPQRGPAQPWRDMRQSLGRFCASQPTWDYGFFVGVGRARMSALDRSHRMLGDVVQLHSVGDHATLAQKVLEALQWALTHVSAVSGQGGRGHRVVQWGSCTCCRAASAPLQPQPLWRLGDAGAGVAPGGWAVPMSVYASTTTRPMWRRWLRARAGRLARRRRRQPRGVDAADR